MKSQRSTVTQVPELNSRKGEHSDVSHIRKKALLPVIIEQMVLCKEAAGAYGTFTLEIVWRNGEITAVDITDHASYK